MADASSGADGRAASASTVRPPVVEATLSRRAGEHPSDRRNLVGEGLETRRTGRAEATRQSTGAGLVVVILAECATGQPGKRLLRMVAPRVVRCTPKSLGVRRAASIGGDHGHRPFVAEDPRLHCLLRHRNSPRDVRTSQVCCQLRSSIDEVVISISAVDQRIGIHCRRERCCILGLLACRLPLCLWLVPSQKSDLLTINLNLVAEHRPEKRREVAGAARPVLRHVTQLTDVVPAFTDEEDLHESTFANSLSSPRLNQASPGSMTACTRLYARERFIGVNVASPVVRSRLAISTCSADFT